MLFYTMWSVCAGFVPGWVQTRWSPPWLFHQRAPAGPHVLPCSAPHSLLCGKLLWHQKKGCVSQVGSYTCTVYANVFNESFEKLHFSNHCLYVPELQYLEGWEFPKCFSESCDLCCFFTWLNLLPTIVHMLKLLEWFRLCISSYPNYFFVVLQSRAAHDSFYYLTS